MGSCFSRGTPITDIANPPTTANVITPAGALREYPSPVAASDILGSDSAASFLCSSDELYCNEYIPALDPKEHLQAGQIYFVLPVAKLRFPLLGEDMAALAVKASSAMRMLSERGGQGNKKIRIMPVPDVEDDRAGSSSSGNAQGKRSEGKVLPGAPPVVVQRNLARSGSVRAKVAYRCDYRYSRARLSIIPELVE